MSTKFGFQLLTLPEIFDERLFKVPDYQRGFAWTEDQVTDLLKDLEHMRDGQDSEARHYTGTLVVVPDSESERYDIVDGQQRLTTLVVFMNCLAERPEMVDKKPEIIERYVKRGAVGNETYVLQQGTASRDFFQQVIIENRPAAGNSPTTASHANLETARKSINNWLNEHHADDRAGLETLLDLTESRLGMLIYEPDSNSEVGIMFEVINNRGRPLTELEKVKNYLIYLASKLNAPTTQQLINDQWATVLQNLYRAKQGGDGDEHSFLRAASVVFFGLTKKESSDIYSEIKSSRLNIDQIFSPTFSGIDKTRAIKQLESFIRFLASCSYWYRLLHDRKTPTENVSADLCLIMSRLRGQRQHANILPLLFAVLDKHHQQNGDDALGKRLLELIEIVNFRVYLARNSWRSDWGQGPLFSIAGRYWHGKSVTPDDQDWSDLNLSPEKELERRLVLFTIVRSGATNQYLEDSMVLSEDDPYDYARWPGLRYFLISYEEFRNPKKTIDIDQILARKDARKSGDYYSIEHIWATMHDGGRHDGWVDEWVRRRLGNLCLLELNLNIIGRNRGIDEKVPLYRDGKNREGVSKSDLAQVHELIEIAQNEIDDYGIGNLQDGRRVGYRSVHNAICKHREEKFKEFALQRWSLDCFEGYQDAVEHIEQRSA